ncbi:helix-turn-helix domain-containing protein [Roseibium sp.]|uniref:AraC family transcriptional regulator n=1 Tax=Roseibium sp. TaxID=1936156 RepID=UPI003A975339
MTELIPVANALHQDVWLKNDPDLDSGPVSSLVYEAMEVEEVPPHMHERAQLSHVVRGVGVFTIGETSWTLPPLRAIWIPPGMYHAVRYPRSAQMRSLFFDSDSLGSDALGDVQVFQLDDLTQALLREAADMTWGAEPGKIEKMTLDLLFARLKVQSDSGVFLPGGRDPRLRRVMRFMRENPKSDATLDELAAVGLCSKRTLSRLFVEETALSPALWRRQLRMGLALEMLAAGVPASTVAWQLGYSTPGNFTVAFKDAFGVTPSKYFK